MEFIQSVADIHQLVKMEDQENASVIEEIKSKTPFLKNLIVVWRQHAQYCGISSMVRVRFCKPI